MTKVQNPIIGRAKGSAGGMTFSKNSDQNVMRAKAFEVNNPKTQAQTTQRDFFAELQGVVGGFTPDQLRCLFPNKPKKMSRRNALSKQIAEYNVMDGTQKIIDFAAIDTLGNAPTMDFGTTTVETADDYIQVFPDVSLLQNTEVNQYLFFVLLVNVTKKALWLPFIYSVVYDNDWSAPYPTGWEKTDSIQAVMFITNRKEATDDEGFGSFIIKTRPEKKGRNIGN